jgi:hypothetical protein
VDHALAIFLGQLRSRSVSLEMNVPVLGTLERLPALGTRGTSDRAGHDIAGNLRFLVHISLVTP